MPTGEKINKNNLYNLNVGCSYLSGMASGGLKTEILGNSDNILDKKPVFSTYLRSSRYGKSFGWAAKDQEAFVGIEYTDFSDEKDSAKISGRVTPTDTPSAESSIDSSIIEKPSKLKRKKIKIGLDKKSFSPKDCSDALYDVHTETETSLGTCNKLVNNIIDFFECGIFKRFLCNSNTFVKNICEDVGLQSAASLHGSAWTAGSIANKIGKLPDGKYAESERNLQFGPRTFEDGNKWSLSEKLKQEFIDKQQNEIDSELNNNYDSTLNSLKTEVSTELRYSFDGCFTEIDTGSSENKIFASNALLNKTPKDDPKYKEVSRLISLAQKIVYEKYGIHCNKLIPVILRGSDNFETDDVKKIFSLTGASAAYCPSYDCIAVNDFNIYDLNSCNFRKELLATLAHEFTHATLGNNLSGTASGILPNWLNEGLATNAENPGSRSEDKIKYMTNFDLYDDVHYDTYDFYTLNYKLINKWLQSNTDQHELIKNMIEIMNNKKITTKHDYEKFFKANNGNEAENEINPQLKKGKKFILYDFVKQKRKYKKANVIKISDDVKEIPEGAFKDCTNLKKIEIPESVTKIGNNAFESCKYLSSIKLPKNIKNIGIGTFKLNCSLKEIEIPESVTDIGMDALYGCFNLISIEIPESVTDIGKKALFGCMNLKEVEMLKNVTNIDFAAFYSCKKLTKITIPASVISIGEGAFFGCENLKEITIPASVTSIGESAFKDCTNLKSVTILGKIDSLDIQNVFECCDKLLSDPDKNINYAKK